jgi:AcrR family transcriptional regulator
MGELILTKARELFFSYGLKSVSMDDLAKLAGISKKTIYQAFADKNSLVNKIVEDLIQCHYRLFKEVQGTAKDAVDEVLKQASEPFDTWASVSQSFFYELQRSFPEAWQKLEQHKQGTYRAGIVSNLERGMAEGLYRDDLDVAFIADVRLHQLTTALQPAAFTDRRLNVGQLVNSLTLFYLHGITTTKGKTLLNKYVKNRNENRSGK